VFLGPLVFFDLTVTTYGPRSISSPTQRSWVPHAEALVIRPFWRRYASPAIWLIEFNYSAQNEEVKVLPQSEGGIKDKPRQLGMLGYGLRRLPWSGRCYPLPRACRGWSTSRRGPSPYRGFRSPKPHCLLHTSIKEMLGPRGVGPCCGA